MDVNTSMDNAQSMVRSESNKNQNENEDQQLWGQATQLCLEPVKCYDYMTRPCIRKKGHTMGHNPFSDYYPKEGTETNG